LSRVLDLDLRFLTPIKTQRRKRLADRNVLFEKLGITDKTFTNYRIHKVQFPL